MSAATSLLKLALVAGAGVAVACLASNPKRPWQPAMPFDAARTRIKPGEILVVIDMQDRFLWGLPKAAYEETVAAVTQEILDAKAIGAEVVLVEYAGYGETCATIEALLKGYSNCWRVAKHSRGGGAEVLAAFGNRRNQPLHLRVCGIFTDQCVRDTVLQMARARGVSVDVVTNACCTSRPAYRWSRFSSPRWQPNIQLVSHAGYEMPAAA